MFFACGNDYYGRLGLGDSLEDEEDEEAEVHTFQPVVLPDGKQVQQVASCSSFTIVLTTDGSLLACGESDYVNDLIVTPSDEECLGSFQLMTPLPDGKVAKQIVAGRYHTMILTEDDTVFVCG